MSDQQTHYRARRVYEVTTSGTQKELRLSDRIVELGDREFGMYRKIADWLPTTRGLADLSRELGLDEAKVPRIIDTLAESGLLYKQEAIPAKLTGLEFHARFNEVLGSWLTEAF